MTYQVKIDRLSERFSVKFGSYCCYDDESKTIYLNKQSGLFGMFHEVGHAINDHMGRKFVLSSEIENLIDGSSIEEIADNISFFGIRHRLDDDFLGMLADIVGMVLNVDMRDFGFCSHPVGYSRKFENLDIISDETFANICGILGKGNETEEKILRKYFPDTVNSICSIIDSMVEEVG